MMKFMFVCRQCRTEHSCREQLWRCPCGGLLDLLAAGAAESAEAPAGAGLWKYRACLPIDRDENIVSLGEGNTPLVPLEQNGRSFWVKLEQCSPTGSFKDRGASVLISKAKELGLRKVIEDSSGNAGCAMAAYAARAGIECHVYVPAATSPAKLVQMRSYGAHLVLVPGTRQQTADAALAAAEKEYYASHSWNPFFFQGTKTIAYEIREQLGNRAPERLVLPAGNGTLLLGVYIGFQELLKAGQIRRMPRLMAVQSERCCPLRAAREQDRWPPQDCSPQPTLAEGIAVASPVRGPQILEAVRESGGEILTVTEEEIRAALRLLGRSGYYVEPTAAVAVAGILRLETSLFARETVVSVLSGHGLKAGTAIAAILEQD